MEVADKIVHGLIRSARKLAVLEVSLYSTDFLSLDVARVIRICVANSVILRRSTHRLGLSLGRRKVKG